MGYHVSQKTVGRYMKEMGLKAIPEEKYVVTTDSDHDMTIYPNLVNRQFNVETPNTVWVADITYIWTIEGWLYLASIMDLFSRKLWVEPGFHNEKRTYYGSTEKGYDFKAAG
ncbi:hypothetical protein I7V34_03215 [Bacillus sp. V3]|nr:hypothetical protein I7V34_03215 [Bacillus sp. V3]